MGAGPETGGQSFPGLSIIGAMLGLGMAPNGAVVAGHVPPDGVGVETGNVTVTSSGLCLRQQLSIGSQGDPAAFEGADLDEVIDFAGSREIDRFVSGHFPKDLKPTLFRSARRGLRIEPVADELLIIKAEDGCSDFEHLAVAALDSDRSCRPTR